MFNNFLLKEVLEHSFNIPVQVTYANGKTERYGDGEPQVKITFHRDFSMRELIHNASLTLGEAYMDKEIEIEGSIQDLITSAYESADSFLNNNKLKHFLPKQSHTERKSKSDVQSHYDIGNDFYRLWLDKTLTYSCAYFKRPQDTLEEAQRNKVHHIINKLDPKPGKTLLDIGCGTGLELASIYERFPDVKITGIDLSKDMLEKLRVKYADRDIDLIMADYFEYPLEAEKYDAALSFETLHHFKYAKKQKIYEKLFQAIKRGGYYIECDYVACCLDEEILCLEQYEFKRKENHIPDDVFVHIDIPLTLEHQIQLMKNAGFRNVHILYENKSTMIIKAEK